MVGSSKRKRKVWSLGTKTISKTQAGRKEWGGRGEGIWNIKYTHLHTHTNLEENINKGIKSDFPQVLPVVDLINSIKSIGQRTQGQDDKTERGE